MTDKDKQPHSIAEASAQAAALPGSAEVTLADGSVVAVKRLSWLQFEALYGEIAGLLESLLNATAPGQADDAALLAQLSGAPALVLKLAVLSTGRSESALAQLDFDAVLAIAAAALELNFVAAAGLRSFFAAAARLASAQ